MWIWGLRGVVKSYVCLIGRDDWLIWKLLIVNLCWFITSIMFQVEQMVSPFLGYKTTLTRVYGFWYVEKQTVETLPKKTNLLWSDPYNHLLITPFVHHPTFFQQACQFHRTSVAFREWRNPPLSFRLLFIRSRYPFPIVVIVVVVVVRSFITRFIFTFILLFIVLRKHPLRLTSTILKSNPKP